MDVSFGVRLWADDAAEEKKIRFDKSHRRKLRLKNLAFRVAGMRVWQGHGARAQTLDEDGIKKSRQEYGRFYS